MYRATIEELSLKLRNRWEHTALWRRGAARIGQLQGVLGNARVILAFWVGLVAGTAGSTKN